MTRARPPRSQEVQAARRDPRLRRALACRVEDATWRMRGACRRCDPEAFFPAPNELPVQALALCAACPVQGECLAWALEVSEDNGVWGGTTPKERRPMSVVWGGQRDTGQREAERRSVSVA